MDKNSWYYEDIGRAVSTGYIEGYDDGTMKPNEPITREEASKLINQWNIVSGSKRIENGSTIDVSLKERDHLKASGFPNAFIINNPGKSNYCVMADGYLSL